MPQTVQIRKQLPTLWSFTTTIQSFKNYQCTSRFIACTHQVTIITILHSNWPNWTLARNNQSQIQWPPHSQNSKIPGIQLVKRLKSQIQLSFYYKLRVVFIYCSICRKVKKEQFFQGSSFTMFIYLFFW